MVYRIKNIIKHLIFLITFAFSVSQTIVVFAYWDINIDYNNITNPWTQLGEDGVFDYADGDLEDKLGDWDIYKDIFPEDYEDDENAKEYNYSYPPSKDTFKYEHVDISTTDYYYTGSSCGNENKPHYKKDIKKPQVYTGGRWVKRTNWHTDTWVSKYMDDWYYYPYGNNESLKLTWAYIDNILYFFNRYGWMEHDSTVRLDGKAYHADSNGACTLKTEW